MMNEPAVVEIVAAVGFDFVIIDCEHSSINPFGSDLAHLLRAAEARRLPALVRTASHDAGQILRALDLGAAGVVVPHVRSALEASAIVEYGQFAPTGARSSCPCSRQSHYGCRPFAEVLGDADPLLIALIEDPAGVAAVDAITATPGLSGVFFGPFDYGIAAGPDDLDVEAARDLVYGSAREAGKLVGDLAWDGEDAARLSRRGASFVGISTDVMLLGDGMRQALPSDEGTDRS